MDDFIDMFAKTMLIDKKRIKPEDQFRKYKEWDSLTALDMITMLKQNYDIVIPRRKFDNLLTLQDVYKYISQR